MVFVLIDSSYYSYTVKVMLSTYKKRIIDVKIQILKSYKETWTTLTQEEGNIIQAHRLLIN